MQGGTDGYSQRIQELGTLLRTTREAKGIALADAVEATKVRSRYLLALEQGNLSILPGAVYTRGFVRCYADYLGLDGMQTVNAYLGSHHEEETDTDKVAPSKPALTSRPSQSSAGPRQPMAQLQEVKKRPMRSMKVSNTSYTPRALGVTAIIVVVFAVAVSVYAMVSKHDVQKNASHVKTGSTTSNQKLPTVTVTTTGNKGHSKSQPTHVVTHTTPSTTIVKQSSAGSVTTYQVQTTRPLMVVHVGDINGRSWMQITADGKPIVPSLILNSGQSRTWTAKSSMKVFLGANEYVHMTINGTPIPVAKVSGAFTYVFTKK